MYTKTMSITPAEATLWLDTKNSRNRPVSQSTVDRYAQEMKQGNWKLNGQPIIFGKSGQLLNGQHRLKAIVQSNITIETVVTYGIDDETFDTMDDGNKRSLADVMAIRGESNAPLLSAGVRFLWMYATGQVGTRDLRRGVIGTKKVLEETLDKHPGLRRSVKFYNMLKQRQGGLLLPSGMVIGLHYLFALVNEQKCDQFFTMFQSGLGLTEGHPVALLRQRLIQSTTRGAAVRLTNSALYFYTVTAWNAFMQDKTIRSQNLAYDGVSAPPEIADLPKKLMKDLL